MALFNYATRELSAKIVYYGPGLSGKTTNIEMVHQMLRPEQKGRLISLPTETDRTLFFDFLPVDLGNIKGFKVRFHLYTVPGQVYYNATRRLVLQGVDGVVFVADSQVNMMSSNLESLRNLRDNLATYGKKLEDLPFVLQYNKRDLRNISSVPEMSAQLNDRQVPVFEGIAKDGVGVTETLVAISRLVFSSLRKTLLLPGETAEAQDLGAIEEVAARIRPQPEATVPLEEISEIEEIPEVREAPEGREPRGPRPDLGAIEEVAARINPQPEATVLLEEISEIEEIPEVREAPGGREPRGPRPDLGAIEEVAARVKPQPEATAPLEEIPEVREAPGGREPRGPRPEEEPGGIPQPAEGPSAASAEEIPDLEEILKVQEIPEETEVPEWLELITPAREVSPPSSPEETHAGRSGAWPKAAPGEVPDEIEIEIPERFDEPPPARVSPPGVSMNVEGEGLTFLKFEDVFLSPEGHAVLPAVFLDAAGNSVRIRIRVSLEEGRD